MRYVFARRLRPRLPGALAACFLLSCVQGPDPAGLAAGVGREPPPAATAATQSAAGEPIVLMWQVQQSGPRGDFALLRGLGINTVQSSRIATWPPDEARGYLDAAEREGLRVIAYLGVFREGTGPGCGYAPPAMRFIDEFRDHPALFAWHSLDEPAGHRIAPACQRALYEAIKRRDPSHPVLVSTNNDDEADYDGYFAEDAFDIYEVHKYVNPHPAAAQGRMIELLRARRTRDYPVIITLRAFNAPHKPLRLDMREGSLDEQYEFFIAKPGITRNVGFYGWELAPNRGIRDDPGLRDAFAAFTARRLRDPEARLR